MRTDMCTVVAQSGGMSTDDSLSGITTNRWRPSGARSERDGWIGLLEMEVEMGAAVRGRDASASEGGRAGPMRKGMAGARSSEGLRGWRKNKEDEEDENGERGGECGGCG
jgi:hypothetical protein